MKVLVLIIYFSVKKNGSEDENDPTAAP